MEEEVYFLMQVLQKLFRKFHKQFPEVYQRRLVEYSRKGIPNHFTLEVSKAIEILIDEDEAKEFLVEPDFDFLESDICTLRNCFEWGKFLKNYIHYMSKAIIFLHDGNSAYLGKIFRSMLEVFEHHKKKGTHNILSWKELMRVAAGIVEDHQASGKDQAAEDKQEGHAEINEFLLRTIEHIYNLLLVKPPPTLKKMLNEYPENRFEHLIEKIAKAVQMLLNDPTAQRKIDSTAELDTRTALEALVHRAKTAALKYWVNDKFDYFQDVFNASMTDFTEVRKKLQHSQILWCQIQIAARNIVYSPHESRAPVKSADAAAADSKSEQTPEEIAPDTAQLIDSPPESKKKKSIFRCCACKR